MKHSPCYNCPDRQVGCHGKCERYLAYAEKRAEDAEKEREEKKADILLTDFRLRSIDRVKRQNGNTNGRKRK